MTFFILILIFAIQYVRAADMKIYPYIQDNTCESHGYTRILNTAECSAGALYISDLFSGEVLKWSTDSGALDAYDRGNSDYYGPTGCWISYFGDNRLYLSTGVHPNADYRKKCDDNNCICNAITAPICTNTIGRNPNPGECACGKTAVCTSTTGFYCTKSDYTNEDYLSSCAAVPRCVNTDGTKANSVSCICGRTSGTTPRICSGNEYCEFGDIQGWNPYGWYDSRCGGPSCANTDGTVANSDCKCGNADCTSETGLFCQKSSNRCHHASCSKTAGLVENDAPCACGTADCTSETGLFCDASNNKCNDVPSNWVTMYPYITSNTCPGQGYEFIEDPWECQAQARLYIKQDLWVNEITGLTYRWGTPYGCSNDGTSWLAFGSHSDMKSFVCNGPVNDPYNPRVATGCLCKLRAPPCVNSDGKLTNSEDCICGSAYCKNGNTFCDLTNNKCDDLPLCDNKDGSVDNNTPCVCGNVDCTSTTGFFCQASNNRCTKISACANTVGSSVNSASCACGSTTCDADTTGPLCFAAENRCDFLTCDNTDGTVANDAACICGTAECNADTTGSLCFAAENRCDFLTCDNTDGTVANDAACKCGREPCTSSTGLYCTLSVEKCAGGSTTLATPLIWLDSTNDQCHAPAAWGGGVVGTITSLSACRAAGIQFGFQTTYTNSVKDYPSSPAGCIYSNGYTRFNDGAPGSRAPCSTSTQCICRISSAPSCFNSDGLATQEPCVCGDIFCSKGAHCTSAHSYCIAATESEKCLSGSGVHATSSQCDCNGKQCQIGEYCNLDYGGICSSVSIPSCIDKEGDLDTLTDCQCNEAVCSTGQYCIGEKSQCLDEPVVTCTDGSPNENTDACKCISNFCAIDEVCNSGACIYETCSSGETPIKCSCGDTLCERGKHCYATANTCTDNELGICTNTDGTAPTSTDCVCGTDVCSEENGRYCNGDTCEKHHVDAVRAYKIVSSGLCTDLDWEKIKTIDECNIAAAFLNLEDQTTDWVGANNYNYPSGCGYNSANNELKFADRQPGQVDYCGREGYDCICTTIAEPCSYENGQNKNTGSSCQCSTTTCGTDIGMYCTASESRCTLNPICSETSANTQLCTCGNVQCAENTRCKRESDVGYCSCENDLGLASNDKDCLCGDTVCTSGLYCNAAASKCGTHGLFESKKLLTSGTAYSCADTPGFEIISSAAECKRITGMEVIEVDIYDADISARCSINGSVAIYNSEDASPGPCTDEKQCVCLSTGSMCKYTEGKFINQEDTCFCGADYCSTETGMMCNNGVCSDVTSCSNIDGILPNNRDCTCGDTFCSLEPESIKKTVILYQKVQALFFFEERTSGKCEDKSGGAPVGSQAECEEGGSALGLPGTTADVMSGDHRPSGCFKNFATGNLYFNTDTAGTSCSDSKICICTQGYAPACSNTDGSVPIKEGLCNCGNKPCTGTETTQMYCDQAENRCNQIPTCTNTDGTAANPANCVCGTTDCDADTTGLFCDASKNRCDFVNCTNTDGTAANPANCACGTTDCDATTTGLFCDASKNRCRFTACANINGTAANPANCACGTTDCDAATGLFCDASKNQCNNVPYCTITNGTAANSANCACGTTDCDAATGLFCDTSNNDRCSIIPTCANKDGTAPNPATCACGSTGCDAGLYCYESENKCRTFANAVTKFAERTSGKCTDEIEGAWIKTRSKCEEGIIALEILSRLSDTWVSEILPTNTLPRGCVKQIIYIGAGAGTPQNYLSFNPKSDSLGACSQTETCICIIVRPA